MHVFRVTKYDPDHFGDRGYFGPEDSKSDHGQVEAAYLAAVEAFAEDSGMAELTQLALDRETVILEEVYVGNASRWGRLRAADVPAIRDGLTPRARLVDWPELNEDVVAELRTLDDIDLVTVVWEDRDGRSRPAAHRSAAR